MGAMEAPTLAKCPDEMLYLHSTYRQVKFSRVPNEDAFLLIAREVLNYMTLETYSRISGMQLEHWEIEAILCIDSIFERSRGA